ncbi:histone-lysine N-methyltransferase ASHR2 [Mercurialis annua]|uniref:histone-lysine N-methyltransferase ASHR2 n=1 Tax=Mercurialis annua TaxID=3986 RepID=UPI00215F9DD5|nr:histone-lysine N-methyltransferase ASHR2 [Mercurialis annua]XP_050223410.1 histone-lysine N-methyltransferase ASHR2 [Mercurialis annua]XP_050223411.1 histone-lysine N-methyltransferase ASHR2 [Mercurialis annua]XP_055960950.1 histone-lysine N-methyltransferase ASHR2 [Mercurialis annua]
MMGSEKKSALKIEEIEGRGRGAVTCAAVRGGDVVLRDSPILLYSAFPLSLSNNGNYCDNCFRKLQPLVSCPSCSLHHFCSPNCLSASSHTPWVCQAFTRLHHHLHPLERQVQARFLIAAYNLAIVSPAKLQTLLSLQGQPSAEDVADAQSLHSLISSLCPPPTPIDGFSFQLTAALLAKDKLNAFGLMEPYDQINPSGHRSVRAYGIYPRASFFNHDCLPNACRFDYVDAQNSTDLIIRMIHDVPQGREICLSYFPVNLSYRARQNRLLQDYGFTCSCDRCKVEANWSDQEEADPDDDDDDDNDEAMDEDPDDEDGTMTAEAEAEADASDFPHAYFFVKYLCDGNNCGGTLAPLPHSNANSDLLECNVCGSIKADEC